jgi:hypothetical protein
MYYDYDIHIFLMVFLIENNNNELNFYFVI